MSIEEQAKMIMTTVSIVGIETGGEFLEVMKYINDNVGQFFSVPPQPIDRNR